MNPATWKFLALSLACVQPSGGPILKYIARGDYQRCIIQPLFQRVPLELPSFPSSHHPTLNMISLDEHNIPVGLFAEVVVVDRQKAGALADASIGAGRAAKIDKGFNFNSRHNYRKCYGYNQKMVTHQFDKMCKRLEFGQDIS